MAEYYFLGKPSSYWIELESRAVDSKPENANYLQEISDLRGKISFYESRIKECAQFLEV